MVPCKTIVTLPVIIIIKHGLTGQKIRIQAIQGNFIKNSEYEIDLSGGLLGAIQLCLCFAAGDEGGRWKHNTHSEIAVDCWYR